MSLLQRYKVDRDLPISPQKIQELRGAVVSLASQAPLTALIGGNTTPREAVDDTLSSRGILLEHARRLDKLLDHTHGSIQDKYEMLRHRALEVFGGENATEVAHLLAPHRHLMDGFVETRRDILGITSVAENTAALITSAAMGRLMQRSDANRTVGIAVASGALVVALVTVFTGIAAVPRTERLIEDLVRLGGWIGGASVIAACLTVLLARLSALPTSRLPGMVLRNGRWVAWLSGLVAVGLFLSCITTGNAA